MQDCSEVRLLCWVDGSRSRIVHVARASAAVRQRLQDTRG
jgi:hypothetical protein